MTDTTRITRRHFTTLAGATAGTLAMPYVAKAQQAINITIASSHPVQNMWVGPMKNVFQPEVDKILAAGGKFKINWKEAYGGTLYKFQDTMEAVRDGITDFGFVGTLWESDTMPLSNVTYFTPFATDDHKLVISTFDKLALENEKLKAEWAKNNMIQLSSFVTDNYHLWTNFPVKTIEDLKNRKLGAPGTTANWLAGTGAIPVDGALTTFYTNIQTGVTDGAMSFAIGILPTRVYEVAKYITKVNLGVMYVGGLGVNKSNFDKQPKEVQDAFRAAGRVLSTKHGEDISARMDSAFDEMAKKHGSIITDLAAPEREKWIKSVPNIAKTFAGMSPDGGALLKSYFDTLRAAGKKPGREWDKEIG
jgi:TRAP-type C4-dicarboxylate transport system substrate-binding protein